MALNPLRFDPTRTTLLRRAFVADVARRMAAIRRAIIQLVDVEDAFGLKRAEQITKAYGQATTSSNISLDKIFTANTRFAFATDDKKVEGYQNWLKDQVDRGLLEVDKANANTPWVQPYIGKAYKKGWSRAYADANKGQAGSFDFIQGGQEAFLKMGFEGPIAQSKLKSLSTRAFTELKGISADMDKKMTRVLTEGLAKGTGAKALARELVKEVDGMTKGRAATIARTETIRAHNEGQLDSFEAMNLEGVGVQAEWATAHDGKVCPRCATNEGKVFTIKEARGLLPLHPNCRCSFIPAGVGEDEFGTTETTWAGDEQGLEAPGTAPTGKTTGQTWPNGRPVTKTPPKVAETVAAVAKKVVKAVGVKKTAKAKTVLDEILVPLETVPVSHGLSVEEADAAIKAIDAAPQYKDQVEGQAIKTVDIFGKRSDTVAPYNALRASLDMGLKLPDLPSQDTLVPTSGLVPSQAEIAVAGLKNYAKNPPTTPPAVIQIGDKYHVIDHTRTAVQVLAGRPNAFVRLYRYDPETNTFLK